MYQLLFKNYLKYLIAKVKKRKFILTRCACLGRDILTGIDGVTIDNYQKNRIDHKIRIKNHKRLVDHFNDKEIYKMVSRQSVVLSDLWCKPDLIVIDTYSELVDLKFTYKGENFFCVASDLKKDVRQRMGSGTFVDQNYVKNYYQDFFENLKKKYECKIIVILFPSYLDSRKLYQVQFKKIFSALLEIENHTNLISLVHLKEEEYNGDGVFPYHFDNMTKDKIREIIVTYLDD